jgi:hypothetical protein
MGTVLQILTLCTNQRRDPGAVVTANRQRSDARRNR